jgi:hypothetical protein
VHEQLPVLQECVVGLQQLPAVQSLSVQQAVHAPLQHTCPPWHCALVVQEQLPDPHACVVGLQQLPAVQSLSLQHSPGVHLPPQHTFAAVQSELFVQPHAFCEQ